MSAVHKDLVPECEEIAERIAARAKNLPRIGGRSVGSTTGYDFVDGYIVIVTKKSPSKEEWDRYCGFVRFRGSTLRGIACYGQGIPNSGQRGQVRQTLAKAPKIAMITASPLVRNGLGLLAWLLPDADQGKLLAFDPAAEDEALRVHLGASPSQIAAIKALHADLEKEIEKCKKQEDEAKRAAKLANTPPGGPV